MDEITENPIDEQVTQDQQEQPERPILMGAPAVLTSAPSEAAEPPEDMTINGVALSTFGGASLLDYTVSAPELTAYDFMGINRTTWHLLKQTFGRRTITINVIFEAETLEAARLQMSKFNGACWGAVVLALPDGYEYSCLAQNLGVAAVAGIGDNTAQVQAQYTFLGVQRKPLVTVSVPALGSVDCSSTTPSTDARLTTTVGQDQQLSGDIVTFENNGSFGVSAAVVDIAPIQTGSGDPAPDNIRPITGWTAANVFVAGKNLFPDEYADWKDGYYINASGVETANNSYRYTQTFFPCKASTTYVLQYNKPATAQLAGTLVYYNAAHEFLSRQSAIPATANTGLLSGTFTTPADCAFYRLISPRASAVENVQIEEGSTSTDYEPFNATYPVSFGTAGTVYTGTLDVLTGLLTVNSVGIVFDGTESWTVLGSAGNRAFRYIRANTLTTSNQANVKRGCSHFQNAVVTTSSTTQGYGVYSSSGNTAAWLQIRPLLDGVETVADWQAWVKAQYDAGTPLTCWWEPLEPVGTYQLDPVQIHTLLGKNTIWADAGAVSVTFSHGGQPYYLGGARFDDVATGDVLVFDGIDGMVLRNGVNDAANVDWTNFPSLAPGENAMTNIDPLTVEYYPTFM